MRKVFLLPAILFAVGLAFLSHYASGVFWMSAIKSGDPLFTIGHSGERIYDARIGWDSKGGRAAYLEALARDHKVSLRGAAELAGYVPKIKEAQMWGPGIFVMPPSGAAFQGQGDIISGAINYWGTRAYNAAYATGSNNSFAFSCAGGSPSSGNIKVLTNGYADETTLASDCGANAITVTDLYDQIGSANMNIKTSSIFPSLALNCPNTGYVCISFNGSTDIQTANFALSGQTQPITQVATVYNGSAGGTTQWIYSIGTNQYLIGSTNTYWLLYNNSTASATSTVSAAAWHISATVWNGSSSYNYIDGSQNPSGTVTTGSLVLNGTGSNGVAVLGGQSGSPAFTGKMTEISIYPSGFTSGNVTSMEANVAAAYGGI